MFICMQKMNFIIHFFLTILHFKESYNFIGMQHFGPYLETQNYARYVGEISSRILVFYYILFPRKTNITKFFQKYINPYFGSIRGPFAQIGAKNDFPVKKGSVSFSVFQLPTIVTIIRKT